jgi:nitrous oxidase accessory protein
VAAAWALAASACANGGAADDQRGPGGTPGVEPPRPTACLEAAAGGGLQAAFDALPADAALCLAPGIHAGPLRISRRAVVWGPPDAVIRSDGHGTTVRLEADGAALLGVTIDGSGTRYDLLDAAVHVQGSGARIEGVRVRNATHGILVERSSRILVRGCVVEGDPGQTLGLRGDGIRLWETRDSEVVDNHVRASRDVVIWYSPGNRLARNVVEGSRYGTHLMYSHDTRIEENTYLRNVTGIFLMYSRGIEVRGNTVAGAGGAAGIGLGLKESGNVDVRGNRFVHDTTGAYVDASPLYLDDHNRFEGNEFRLSQVGVMFHAGAERNRFAGNRFADNAAHVRVEGRGDARGAEWRGNAFDDYAGYDLDGDGVGDLPYELRSLSGSLTGTAPAIAFFAGTPALALVEAVGRVVPLFTPTALLVDPEPRLAWSSRAD